MTPLRIGAGIGVVLVLYNAARVAGALLGAKSGLFVTPPTAPGIATLWPLAVLAILALCLIAWIAWYDQRNPPKEPGDPLLASALWSALTAAGIGLLMVLVATSVEHTYGWALFVLLPVLMGMQAAMLRGRRQRATLGQSLGAAALSVAILGGLLMGLAVEGAICLAMAVPIAVPLALLGGLVGHALQRLSASQNPATFLLLAGIAPFSASLEHAIQPPAEMFLVNTSIDLQASPERVWQAVVEPASLAPPSQLLFRAGVGYPRASHIEGAGQTATRYCDFSTGKLVEPVLIWDHPHQLRFRVASNPLPMEEWTPYSRIHPPHLDGFLVSRQGEFRLTPLPNGGTRLEASTWYQHHLWPAHYWRWWSDYIIHQVHGMVLENIRNRATLPLAAPEPGSR